MILFLLCCSVWDCILMIYCFFCLLVSFFHKWYLIAMCLVRLWKQVFLTIVIADFLSQNNFVVSYCFSPKSSQILLSQIALRSCQWCWNVFSFCRRLSLSVASWKSMEMHLRQKRKNIQMLLILSTHPPQSLSQKGFSQRVSLKFNFISYCTLNIP